MTALGDHHPSNAIVSLNPLGSVTSNAPLPHGVSCGSTKRQIFHRISSLRLQTEAQQ
jgi:hypothetical protein